MWERYELKDEETKKVKLVYELKRDVANDMVSKRYRCRFFDKSKDEWKEISGTYKKEDVKYRLEQEYDKVALSGETWHTYSLFIPKDTPLINSERINEAYRYSKKLEKTGRSSLLLKIIRDEEQLWITIKFNN